MYFEFVWQLFLMLSCICVHLRKDTCEQEGKYKTGREEGKHIHTSCFIPFFEDNNGAWYRNSRKKSFLSSHFIHLLFDLTSYGVVLLRRGDQPQPKLLLLFSFKCVKTVLVAQCLHERTESRDRAAQAIITHQFY